MTKVEAKPSPAETLAPRQMRRFVRFNFVALLLLLFVGSVYFSLLVPILVSCFFTYLLLPLVDRLERLRVPRLAAVCAIVLGVVALIVFAVVRVVPILYQQVLLLVQLIPTAVNTVIETWLPHAEKSLANFGLMSPEEIHKLLSGASVLARLDSQVQAGITGLWKTGTSLAGGALYLLLIPTLTFFMLKDYRALCQGLKSLVPLDLVEPTGRMVHRINLTLRSVLKGQAIVAGILTILYVIGLSVVGLTSAVAIGVVAGICRVIPYFDVIVGGILSTIVLLSDFGGWGHVLSVVLVFLIVQAIDGAFVTPAVIGERIGLHPVLVILTVFAFGGWLGFWGVLLAVPAAALVKVLIESILPYYRASRAFLPDKEP